jgi:acyl-CoA reductase-like NAD-dependent aldehyde dehydrogenase
MTLTTPDLQRFQMYIGGEFVDALAGTTFASNNPYTGKDWAIVPDGSIEDVDRAVQAARAALEGPWGTMT